MKKALFATTAIAAFAAGSAAFAEDGISLFGDARLGLKYVEDRDEALPDGTDRDQEVFATSRARFGVKMEGTTNSGITFGAKLRADHATAAKSGTAGKAYISGSYGTLSFGDVDGADENWVGDVPGNHSLTGLEDTNETRFLSNGGSAPGIVEDDDALPTVRYDFEVAGFGLSLSTDQNLDDIAIGTGFSGNVGGYDLGVGLGYHDFKNQGAQLLAGNQVSASVSTGVAGFDVGIVYQKIDLDDDAGEFETASIGMSGSFSDIGVGAWYGQVMTAEGVAAAADDQETWGVTAKYDLGGGASINGGVSSDWVETMRADFGVKMSF